MQFKCYLEHLLSRALGVIVKLDTNKIEFGTTHILVCNASSEDRERKKELPNKIKWKKELEQERQF